LSTLHESEAATVKLVQHRKTGQRFVMKTIRVPSQDSDDDDSDDSDVGDEDAARVVVDVSGGAYEDSISDDECSDDESVGNGTAAISISVDLTTPGRDKTQRESNHHETSQSTVEPNGEEDLELNNKNVQKFERDRDSIRSIQQEILVMQQIKSYSMKADENGGREGRNHVVQLHEILEDLDHNAIVLVEEYVSGGDLLDLVQEGRIPIDTVRKYFRQMLLGTQFLHRAGIAHRDIKLENILVDRENGVCKLADFGFAGIMFTSNKTKRRLFSDLAGTFCYLSPEQQQVMVSDGSYDGELVDVWNLGCVLYMMLTGSSPFESDADEEEDDPAEIRQNIMDLRVDFEYRVFTNEPRLKQLLSEGMLVYVDQRWSLQKVLDFKW